MPDGSQHVSQAKHNLTFLESFYPSAVQHDWAITVGFYACVHIIEYAVFSTHPLSYKGTQVKGRIRHSDKLPEVAAAQGIPPPRNISWSSTKGHLLRNILVSENFREIAADYRILYNESRTARYDVYVYDNEFIENFIRPALLAIVTWSDKRFGSGLKVNLPDFPKPPQAAPPASPVPATA